MRGPDVPVRLQPSAGGGVPCRCIGSVSEGRRAASATATAVQPLQPHVLKPDIVLGEYVFHQIIVKPPYALVPAQTAVSSAAARVTFRR